ncbi:MAG TPA: FTR1 family protein [Gemmatimonadaceae bacterium]|nr:FTR1 family protein [Gemmatimonadaceae bacterium]
MKLLSLLLAVTTAVRLQAQEEPVKRLANIVGVAIGEYGKGVDAQGRLISAQEHEESVGFLEDAAGVAARLSGPQSIAARAIIDTLLTAAQSNRPPQELAAIGARLSTALGTAGALDLPVHGVDLGAGATIFAKNCSSCHGDHGQGTGHGPDAPPAVGTSAVMHGVSPALSYRVVSVGVRGTAMPAWGPSLTADQRWNTIAYLTSLRYTPADRAEGEGLFLQNCASCHGATGTGSAQYSHDLSHVPPAIGAFVWQAEHSDSALVAIIRAGVPGTAMPPSSLTDAQALRVVGFLRSLAVRSATIAAASTDSTQAGSRVMSLVNQCLIDARGGRMRDAEDRAFDSYIAFEPLETVAKAKNPGLIATMERHFADLKGAIHASDLRAAERSRDAIEVGMPAVMTLNQPTSGGWSAFFQSFLIIVREGFEAILVVGAVVAFLLKTGHKERLRSIWIGTSLGVLASGVTAVILATVLRALPASTEIIEGATLLVAVAVLFSVSYWLISKVEAAKWQQFIKEKVTTALAQGGGTALAFVAFLAVYREGAETALFYQALFSEGSHLVLPLSLGIVIGGATLAVIFTLFYRFGVRIPLRPFFTVTSALLYYMAFVFAGKGIRELQEGGAVPITIIHGFPTVEAMGIFNSVETLLAQCVLLALLAFALARTFWPKRSVQLPTVPPVAGQGIDERLVTIQSTLDALGRQVSALEEELVSGSGASTSTPPPRQRTAKR